MPFPLIQVDAFTDTPYTGNPAAVCILPAPRPDPWMQAVAAEMNLSETAFLVRRTENPAPAYDLRWFTPKIEVDLCGHATLASAHVLWSEGHIPETETVRFHTRSGWLPCFRDAAGWIVMDFPARPPTPIEPPASLLEALGQPAVRFVGRNAENDYFIELPSAQAVRDLTPVFETLQTLPQTRGIIVTSVADSGEYDFISRFFAPAAGIPEDPVTGSAHCALAPYWQERLGKNTMLGFQASPRGGVVRVQPAGERVQIAGQAVTVLRGELLA